MRTIRDDSALGDYLEASALREAADRPEWLRKLREDGFRALLRGRLSHHARRGLALHQRFAPLRRHHFRLLATDSAGRFGKSRSSRCACQAPPANSSSSIGRFAPRALDRWASSRGHQRQQSCRRATPTMPRAVEQHLGRYLDTERDAFCALNTAFVEDGAYVHICAAASSLEQPIHLLFVSTSQRCADR